MSSRFTIRRYPFLCLFTLGFLFVFPLHTANLMGQGFAEHTFVELTGDGQAGTTPDWLVFPYGPVPSVHNGGIGFAVEGAPLSHFNIMTDAPSGAVAIGSGGLGVGFGAFAGAGNRFASAPIHVVGGDPEDAYPGARIIVQDRSPAGGFEDMLTLTNQFGGGLRFTMSDGGDSGHVYAFDNVDGRYSIVDFDNPNTIVPFSIAPNAGQRVEIGQNGLGVGTAFPTSRVHVFADNPSSDSATITSEVTPTAGTRNRTMLNLVNSGGNFMAFTDTSLNSTWFFSNANDELNLRKAGGGVSPAMRIKNTGEVAFVANSTNSFQIFPNGDVRTGPGGSYLTTSDRNMKENFQTLDSEQILEKVSDLTLTSWNYKKDQAQRRHIGPMAQDFHAAFSLGNDDKTISEMDKSGVALAAIQGLNSKVEQKQKQILELTKANEAQAQLIEELNERMERLELLVAPLQK